MIRIAFVIDTIVSPTAGTEKQLLLLLRGLDRQKFSPYLICLRSSEWLRLNHLACPVITYNVSRLISFNFLRTVFRFSRFCRTEHIDIVQTYFLDANIMGTIASRLANRKTIVSSRRNIGHWHNPLRLALLRVLRHFTTHYLANSQAAASHTVNREGVHPNRIKIIYNGLELSKFKAITYEMGQKQREQWHIGADHLLVGTVANLRDVKNIDSLIAASVLLKNDFPDVKFVVVGEGPERRRLEALVKESGVEASFQLVGSHNDIVSCLAAFDLAVQCSTHESFSNSLIEYMAAGLPIAASNIGGNSEAITHEKEGLLYQPDDHHGLMDALARLIKDKTLANTLALHARERAVALYSAETCLTMHEQYYVEIAEEA
jgi:L-malate glycosyltransferase